MSTIISVHSFRGGTGKSARELKVWVHQITPEGESERVPAVVEISSGEQSPRQFDLGAIGEQVLVRLSGGCTVQIRLTEASAA